MSNADKFVATGGDHVIVGFETAPVTQSEWLALGAGVWGRQCGVVGVGGLDTINALMAAPNPDPNVTANEKITRVPALQGTGVHGLGDLVGVLGDGEVAVMGRGKTGVRGNGAEFGVHGEGPIGVFGDNRKAPAASQAQGAGVSGQSDHGIGVLGVSRTNRAGVFSSGAGIADTSSHEIVSKVVPQICLPAILLDPGSVTAQLPRAGIAGDLLAVMPRERGSTAALWFCVSTGQNDPSSPGATWAPVVLGTPVTVP